MDERVMELEIAVAEQGELLRQLNEAVTEQRRDIDRILTTMKGMRESIDSLQERPDPRDEPPPPHY